MEAGSTAAFAKVVARPDQAPADESVIPWFYRTLRNAAIDLRDLTSRTAEAGDEEEVWRVSAETLDQNRSSSPFAFLYEYRGG